MASWRCVRPILMMCENSWLFLCRAERRLFMLGMRDSSISRTAAMCITVGKLSLEDADMLT